MNEATGTLTVRLTLPRDRFELAVEFETNARVTALLGASGAGKSSLLRALAGLERGAVGRVVSNGETWLDSERGVFLRPERRRVGYVPQEGLLFPHLDVRANLLAGAGRARRAGVAVEETLAAVCRLLELDALLERAPHTLSGGERRRVALGRAICSGPRRLLLDEPLASLDLPLRRRILPYLRRVRDELGIPMLLVTHDPWEALALADEVMLLAGGGITAAGPPAILLTGQGLELAREEGWENLLPATVLSRDARTSRVRLGGSGLEMTVPATRGGPGRELLVGIPAREIILSLAEPRGLSARNALPATLVGVRPGPALLLAIASLAPGLPELAIEITEEARAELDLSPGLAVHLIVKTAGCLVYE